MSDTATRRSEEVERFARQLMSRLGFQLPFPAMLLSEAQIVVGQAMQRARTEAYGDGHKDGYCDGQRDAKSKQSRDLRSLRRGPS